MFIKSIQHGPTQALYAAIELIKDAKEEVLLSTFVLEGQAHAGKCLIDAILQSKATKIKLLTNHFFLYSAKTLDYLKLFACLGEKVETRVWKHSFMNANHAKFIVVDGLKCSLGGYNFQEAFFMSEENAWSDLGIVVYDKTLSQELTSYFNLLWNKSSLIDCPSSKKKTNFFTCPVLPKGRILELNYLINKQDNISVLTQAPKKWFQHSKKSTSFLNMMSAFESATKTIDILSPNVIDSCLWKILTEKLSLFKNFKIRILTNYGLNFSQSIAYLWHTEETLLCSKKNKNLQIRYSNGALNHKNKKVYLESDEHNWPVFIDHSKYFCIDNETFYIGSFNMDKISLHASGECGIIVQNEPEVATKINEFVFEANWQKATELIC